MANTAASKTVLYFTIAAFFFPVYAAKASFYDEFDTVAIV